MLETVKDDELLTTAQVAQLLHVKPGTLEVWRSAKRYPLPYTKIGSKVLYRKSAVLQFIAARTQAS